MRSWLAIWAFVTVLAWPIAGCSRLSARERPGTVKEVLAAYGPAVEREFRSICRRRGIAYPPKRIYLLAFKKERTLEVWGSNPKGRYRRLASYPILAASGVSGPKRRAGDRQVPEGFYRITHLNPQSQFHLSLRVDYPNREDIANAVVPQDRMGGDIYVHGNQVSIGCIALGDRAIEKVFCLTALAEPSSRRILIAPMDFRKHAPLERPEERWLRDLYVRVKTALESFPLDGGGRTRA